MKNEMSNWQPIETAPHRESESVLLYWLGETIIGWWSDAEGWCTRSGFNLSPSHWMPLPSSPTGETK